MPIQVALQAPPEEIDILFGSPSQANCRETIQVTPDVPAVPSLFGNFLPFN